MTWPTAVAQKYTDEAGVIRLRPQRSTLRMVGALAVGIITIPILVVLLASEDLNTSLPLLPKALAVVLAIVLFGLLCDFFLRSVVIDGQRIGTQRIWQPLDRVRFTDVPSVVLFYRTVRKSKHQGAKFQAEHEVGPITFASWFRMATTSGGDSALRSWLVRTFASSQRWKPQIERVRGLHADVRFSSISATGWSAEQQQVLMVFFWEHLREPQRHELLDVTVDARNKERILRILEAAPRS